MLLLLIVSTEEELLKRNFIAQKGILFKKKLEGLARKL